MRTELCESAARPQRWLRVFVAMLLGMCGTAVLLWAMLPAEAGLGEDIFFLSDIMSTTTVAWGDVDGDGDLDVAVGSLRHVRETYEFFTGTVKVFLNEDGVLAQDDAWEPDELNIVWEVAWGDVDGDGDLDLAVANQNLPNRVYYNEGGELELNASWTSDESDPSRALAWGDVNGDGYLDLAVGNEEITLSSNIGVPNRVYLNAAGLLETTASWDSADTDFTRDVDWGDVDNDGDLDLAVANFGVGQTIGEPNKVYLNNGGTLDSVTPWESNDNDRTWAIAWGDVNHDGYPELVAGNSRNFPDPNPPTGGQEKMYFNDVNGLQTDAGWISTDADETFALKWGDVDGDGDLDLAAGNGRQFTKVYTNDGEMLATSPDWDSAALAEYVYDLGWGDLDGDHDLDLAVPIGGEEGAFIEGNQPTKIYLNDSNPLANAPPTLLNDLNQRVSDVAWGDIDNDGDLDLATAVVAGRSRIYLNMNGVLEPNFSWQSNNGNARALAWGDVNGDGWLDLATAMDGVGGGGHTNYLYINQGGTLPANPSWDSQDSERTWGLAFGDVDNDGDLDLAVANLEGVNKVYFNDNGNLQATDTWQTMESLSSRDAAWGDVDGDGDLDLAFANDLQENQVYLNVGGVLSGTWESAFASSTYEVAWGDVDGDGDLDLAAGNNAEPNRVYFNENGALQPTNAWLSEDTNKSLGIAWGDVDNDGDLDLAAANGPIWDGTQFVGGGYKVYRNEDGMLRTDNEFILASGTFVAADWGDMDNDGDLDLALAGWVVPDGPQLRSPTTILNSSLHSRTAVANAPPTIHVTRPGMTGLADFYATAEILDSDVISVAYNLFDAESDDVGWLKVSYSLDGGDNWIEAVPVSGTQTTALAASPSGVTHIYPWDTYASGFFGQSDNVVLRFEAYPSPVHVTQAQTYLYPNRVPGPYQFAYAAASTFPARVRGTQVQVFSETIAAGNELAGAIVYRLPAGQTIGAQPMASESQQRRFFTNQTGFLEGRGELKIDDQLVALYPITGSFRLSMYHTSAAPTVTGLDLHKVSETGVQQLAVSADNTLLLFNLNVSLEWDARQDTSFLSQLQDDIQKASAILYDVTNGQVAIGKVRVFHQKGFWGYADLTIVASNSQRPSAILGGVVLTPTDDVDVNGDTITNAYFPGQIRMGPTWNRFGDPGGTIGEDWPRTLAHEMGHYLLHLPDNYLGIENGLLTLINCEGSIMSDPYLETEILTEADWVGDCEQTLAETYFGRTDWATVGEFYPQLITDTVLSGPTSLPLGVTEVQLYAPFTPTTTIVDNFFRLAEDVNGQPGDPVSIPLGRGQAYLIKTNGTADATDDYIILEGAPVGDKIQARGASRGDRLCVFDFQEAALGVGCLDTIGTLPTPVLMTTIADWQPKVDVTPVGTDTVIVTVTNVINENSLHVQLMPQLGRASAVVPMANLGGGVFTQRVSAPDGAYFGHVRIEVPDSTPHKEFIVDYVGFQDWSGQTLPWNGPHNEWGGRVFAWGGHVLAWGGHVLAWGGHVFAWGAPVMSSDGQVSVFPLEDLFGLNQVFSLQKIPLLPELPEWLFPVGQAYRFETTGDDVPESAVVFRYLADNVPAGQEQGLAIYYSADDGDNWTPLETKLDSYRNHATTPIVGEGIYILISTIEIPPFQAAWNNFAYPLPVTRTVPAALASIVGLYTSVYHFDPSQEDPWSLYDATVEAPLDSVVNDLTHLRFGYGYWLYATEPVTLYLAPDTTPGEGVRLGTKDPQNVSLPPATYYGWITPTADFDPLSGTVLTAVIEGEMCGQAEVISGPAEGRLAYVIHVLARDITGANNCGMAGDVVTFQIGDKVVARDVPWRHERANYLSFAGVANERIYAPLVQTE